MPPLPPDDDALLAHLDASAALLGIVIDPAWRAEALANLRTLALAAGAVLDFPLPDEAEPAPVFRA
ncbi:DUF4089 domain-containing protein [Roseomonas sp. OT10]|uniref:DUF4089 domain-containing protein n=1 Tax=Roseomonas cutis TaxID=2897332 RepID=UPI001E5FB704|nr:DUF4089 domain-containing protein [Roseomonas sp. OT10]UFN47945.1 DUF4089 domain-containing protein [Roseomonas sp. OT10]